MQVNQTSLKSLGPALLRAQRAIKGTVKEGSNPFYKGSKYATLENVMDAIKSHLNNEGIIILQPVGFDAEGNYVETQLLHAESGESVSSKMRLILTKNDMQQLGSAVSYARRYSLQSLVFLGAEDDDGNATLSETPKNVVSKSTRESFKPKAVETAKPSVANGSNDSEW